MFILEITMKTCTVCKEDKPFTEFYVARIQKDGVTPTYFGYCKKCGSEKHKKRWDSLSKGEKQEMGRQGRERMGVEYHKNYKLKSRYGIDTEILKEMLDKQDHKCYTCGTEIEYQGDNSAQVDHDHETGKVRKLLCRPCNTSLGLLQENTETFQRMINYINENK